jgi:hypothetical protein
MPNSRKSKSHKLRRSKTKSKSKHRYRKSSHKHSRSHKSSHKRDTGRRSKVHSKRKIAEKANPELWKQSVKKALHKFDEKRSARMYQHAVQIYKSEGGQFKGPKSTENSLHRWSLEYKDEPKSLKSKVNRILKNDSGRIRMMRKFT